MDRRRALKLFAALGATGLTAACGTNPTDERTVPVSNSPVRIGLLVPQTGGYKPIGDDITSGFQLYLDLNDGRLGGHLVELLVADEGETAATGKAGMGKLLQSNVLALTGVVNSAVMMAIRDQVEKAKIPLIGSNASPVSMQGVIYIWRTSYVNDEPGRALGPYVADRVNGRVAMISPRDPAGQDVMQGFRQAFGPSDPRIASETIWTANVTKPGRGFFRPYLEQIRNMNASAVFCYFTGSAGVEFVRQFRAFGLRQTIYAPGFLTEGTALDELGDDAEGIVTGLNYSADLTNGANRIFAAEYRKAHGTSPTTYAMASYDAAQVLDKAIGLAGEDLNPQQLNLMLGKVGQVDSPRGSWQFNQPRTPQQKWYLREVRRDGQLLSNMLIKELATLG
jgi:branched-chain amino acid transport system substrate-binding protein